MNGRVELITQAEYARRRGVAKSAVAKAVKEGRITLIEGKVDPAVADIQWARNTRARADSRPASADLVAGKGVVAVAGRSSLVGPSVGFGGGFDESYHAARARREAAEAQIAELELARALEKVIEVGPAMAAVFTAFRSLRDAGMVLGRKLASQLAPMADAREIQHAIDAAQREIFDTFARKTLPGLLAKVAGQQAQAFAGELAAVQQEGGAAGGGEEAEEAAREGAAKEEAAA